MEIKTFIGRKLNYINGILRVHSELSKPLKQKKDVNFTYEYYNAPKNPLDFFVKRFIQYPIASHFKSKKVKEDMVFNISFQYLGDLAYFLNLNKTIITCADIYTFTEKKNLRNPWVLQKYLSSGLKKCKYMISISDFTKDEMIKKFEIPENKITVIKCAINQEIFKPISKEKIANLEPLFPNYKKILHVGTEAGRKDFITLLKAFYLIRKRKKNIKLIRVGTPIYTQLIKQMNLENDIVYIPNVNDERLKEIYNLCDFFVFPSTYEGFGLPGLEAVACGIPVICSDIAVFREIYQDFPLYFPPRDFKNLAKLILESIDNETLKKDIVKKGFDVLKQYSWKNSAEIYYNLIKEVLNNA